MDEDTTTVGTLGDWLYRNEGMTFHEFVNTLKDVSPRVLKSTRVRNGSYDGDLAAWMQQHPTRQRIYENYLVVRYR